MCDATRDLCRAGRIDADGGGTVTAGADAIAKATGCASIKVAGDQKRFYCAEITHDAGSGVICSCVAIARPFYSPAAEPALVVSA